jgi:hypothetical protein
MSTVEKSYTKWVPVDSLLSMTDDHFGDIDIDGKVILKRNKEIWKDVGQIQVDQNRKQWRAVVKTVMNLRVP